jgi:hypothetical protein
MQYRSISTDFGLAAVPAGRKEKRIKEVIMSMEGTLYFATTVAVAM